MRPDLCIVLTARMGSERLPGKAMAEVNGQPLIYWLIRRLQTAGNLVLGITTEPADDPLAALGSVMGVPVMRWQKGDVIGTVDMAYKTYYPKTKLILRGLADMPWLATDLVERACDVMRKTDSEAFAWALQPDTLPVYGAREFPYSVSGWQKIVANSQIREHCDLYFHEHRDKFRIAWHVPPKPILFRNYRMEVDYPQDLAMVRAVAKEVSMLAPLERIIKFMDSKPTVAQLNRSCTEKTGPSLMTYETKRSIFKSMENQPITDWDNKIWTTPSSRSQPVFCKSGSCLMGLADNGILFSPHGRFKGNAYLKCECGSGLLWNG